MQQNWPLRETSAALRAAGPALRADAIAGMVDAIGEPDFAPRLLACVDAMLPAGSLSAYVLSRQGQPELVASATRERPDRTLECWQAYRSTLFRHDRTFDPAWDRGDASLTHCTRAAFVPAHRTQIYDRLRSHERLSITMPTDDGRLLAVNLYRNHGQPGFSADDAAAAAAFAMPLLACVRQQARRVRSASASAAPPLRERLVARCPRLTARELDVLEHLARGCTYDGISAALGLSVATVKTYRERAFLKLGLHFRSELAALLIAA